MKHKTQNIERKRSGISKMFQVSGLRFQERGFTLIESLVAIAVFTVGVSAAIFVIQQSFVVGSRVKNKITAAYLAQEGVEVVRSIRDRNWIQGKVYNVDSVCYSNSNCWTSGISDSDGAGNPVKTGYVEYNSDALNSASPSASLAFNGFFYRIDPAGRFSRSIVTQFFPSIGGEPEYLKVTSAVSCGAGCSVSLEENLYNWK